MKLNGLIFSHFYKAVTDYIYTNELTQTQRDNFRSDGSAIWKAKQNGYDRAPKIYQLYLPEGTDADYLIKKKGKLGLEIDYEEDVKDRVIIHCLEKKLKRKLPVGVPDEDASINRIRAKILMQYFIQEKLPSYFSENKLFYEVWDASNKRLIFENLNRKKNVIKTATLHIAIDQAQKETAQVSSIKTVVTENDSSQLVTKFFLSYFELINNRKYLSAFDYWHPIIRQNNWRNGASDFSAWFNRFQKFDEVCLFNILMEKEGVFEGGKYYRQLEGHCLIFCSETVIINTSDLLKIVLRPGPIEPHAMFKKFKEFFIYTISHESLIDSKMHDFLRKIPTGLIGYLEYEDTEVLRNELLEILPDVIHYKINRIFNATFSTIENKKLCITRLSENTVLNEDELRSFFIKEHCPPF